MKYAEKRCLFHCTVQRLLARTPLPNAAEKDWLYSASGIRNRNEISRKALLISLHNSEITCRTPLPNTAEKGWLYSGSDIRIRNKISRKALLIS
jgi:hypothetical protein